MPDENALSRQVDTIAAIMEQRGIRLDSIDTRLSQMAMRINDLEKVVNEVRAYQNVAIQTQSKDDRYQQILIAMVSGVAALALGGLGLSITTLITLLNHISIK